MSERPFLEGKYPDLHQAPEVESAVQRAEVQGQAVADKPSDRIDAYLERLEEIVQKPEPGERQTLQGQPIQEVRLDILKDKLHKQFVITPEAVPEGYFALQQRLARERGHGDVVIGDMEKREMADTIIKDQTASLDQWVDYLASKDAAYPTWLKYWAFRSISKLSSYDKEKHAFGKRSAGTTAPFPDLNREALAYVLDAVTQEHGENIDDEGNDLALKKLVQGANFAKLYAYAIEKVTPASQEQKEVVTGEWVKYDQGSDAKALSASLQGFGTSWCTAGEQTAQAQLNSGDFYVYYSTNEQGQNTVPRVAIRMEHGRIGEVRGIEPEQNLEGNMTEIANQKMAELPGAEEYEKKSSNMKRLTNIDNRSKAGEALGAEDLRFLYQLDEEIIGFGYKTDPRIAALLKGRDTKADLSEITGIAQEEISTNFGEAMQGDKKLHYGDIAMRYYKPEEYVPLPEIMYGDLVLNGVEAIGKMELPREVHGNLEFPDLHSAEGLRLPKNVTGRLSFSELQSPVGLVLPETLGGSLHLENLQTVEGVVFPKVIHGDLGLANIGLPHGLELPEEVHGSLNLSNLHSIDGVRFPKKVGALYLGDLASANGAHFPETIDGNLYLQSLQSAKDVVLPKTVRGTLSLDGLQTAEGLVLPESISQDIILKNLTSAEGLHLPAVVNGNLDLRSLTSANGLHLPERINGDLGLYALKSPEGLVLPQVIDGNLDMYNMTSSKGLEFPESLNNHIVRCNFPDSELAELRQKYPEIYFQKG